jgi:pSer/pThr/pTyr-binding forkhead associated (FHA) protein
MWKLVIEDDEGNRTVVPLTRDQYSIGRRDGNTIRLTERNVSRDHARLVKKPAGAAGANGANGAAIDAGDGAKTAPHPKPSKPDLSKAGGEATAVAAPGAAPAGDLYVLEDLTSYNGVFVNGLRIHHSQDLTQGDLVQIGDYRIILQDESQAAAGAATGEASDPSKVTLPGAPFARAAGLLDRPNRLVMLVGPAPGSEFPLDRDLMTVGRAEDASISVNHNSVSRAHCEIHALGQGRFEIVDKGSSNGVRVNGSDLRRGIVEPGDLIELGDVRFKFIGAGQVFRPTDSQQFTILSESDATDVHARRPRRSSALIPAAVFVSIVAVGAVAVFLRVRSHAEASNEPVGSSAPSREQAALDDAKKVCTSGGDCDTARMKLESLVPDSSALRGSPDFRDVETRAADQVLARADAETDMTRKRGLYQRVSQNVAADSSRRRIAADKLQQLDSPPAAAEANQLPIAAAALPAEPAAAPSPTPTPHTRRGAAAAAAEPAAEPAMVAAATPSPAAAAPAAPKGNVDDRERQLALQGTQDSKVLLKQQLEPRVFGGRASDTEIRLLISTCKDLGDRLCVQQARAVQAQRGQ